MTFILFTFVVTGVVWGVVGSMWILTAVLTKPFSKQLVSVQNIQRPRRALGRGLHLTESGKRFARVVARDDFGRIRPESDSDDWNYWEH